MDKKQELEIFYGGNNDIIAKWLMEYKPKLTRIIIKFLHKSLVKDVFQDVFLGLALIPAKERIFKFRPTNFNIFSALAVRVKRRSIDVYRSRKRIEKHYNVDELFHLASGEMEKHKKEEALEELNFIIAVAKQYNKLNAQELEIIEYLLKGYSNIVIAEIMDSDPIAIGRKKHQLVRKLKKAVILILGLGDD